MSDNELAELADMAEMLAREVAYFHGISEGTENSVLSPASCGQMARLLERALAAAARLRELSAEVDRLDGGPMNDDIVGRMRRQMSGVLYVVGTGMSDDVMFDSDDVLDVLKAADEIERLRAAGNNLADATKYVIPYPYRTAMLSDCLDAWAAIVDNP